MLQPEPVALLGQSASSFMVFIYTIEQSNSPILITLRGPGDASASRTKLHILGLQPCAFEKGGKRKDGGEGERERGEGRLQQWVSADRVPY